jgi:protein gp37
MSVYSKIEWTDATWNPLRGCTKISPGCKHCYAEAFAERFRGVPKHPYQQGFDLRLVPEKLAEPFQWSRTRTVFVNSMSDLFQPEVPDEYIEDVVRVMMEANWHTYQVLTKRSKRLRDLLLTKLNFASGDASGHSPSRRQILLPSATAEINDRHQVLTFYLYHTASLL